MIKLKGKDMQALQKRGARAKHTREAQPPETAGRKDGIAHPPAPAQPPAPVPQGPSPDVANALGANREMLERIQEAQHRANIHHATQMERLAAAIGELMQRKITPRPWVFTIERDSKGRSETIRANPVLGQEENA